MAGIDLNDLKINHIPARPHKSFAVLWFLAVLAFGMAAGAALVTYWPQEAEIVAPADAAAAASVRPDPPAPGAEPAQRDAFSEGGWIEVPSYHPIIVSSLLPGRVDVLHVLEGSRVEKGTVVAELYRKDKEDALAQAEAEAAAAKAAMERLQAGFRVQEIEQARADLAAAEAEADVKQKVFERTRDLLAAGAVSPEDLEQDEAACRMAAARRDALAQELLLREEGSRTEDIRAAEAEYQRRLALLNLARSGLEYTTIRSPADGVVLERFVTPGTAIGPQDLRIVSLYDPADLQVRVDVRQENIAGVFVGQQVEVFTDVEPGRAYGGEVIRIDPLADFKKNTIQVKVRLYDPGEALYPEMIARIRFQEGNSDDGADG